MSIRLYLDLDRGLYLLPHEGSPVSAGACRHVVSEMCAVMCLGRRRPPAEAGLSHWSTGYPPSGSMSGPGGAHPSARA